ncbi:nuclear transport factor 2 family protein [Leucobacter sp. GX24907]
MADIRIPAALQRFVDSINEADTDAFVAAFTAEGFVDDWGRVLSGPEGVRSWAMSDAIGAGAQMTILEASTSDDVTEVRFRWVSRVFTGESTAFVTIAGDRIASFRIPPHA